MSNTSENEDEHMASGSSLDGEDDDDEMDEEDIEEEEGEGEGEVVKNEAVSQGSPSLTQARVYLPKPLEDGEELECDESAYVMYHQAQTGAPCLSFDIILDELGNGREEFPLTTYLVAGTQAPRSHANRVIVMKMNNLSKNKSQESDEENSDEENGENDSEDSPEMISCIIRHNGCINRIRTAKVKENMFAATWSELGKVYIWNLEKPLEAVDQPSKLAAYVKKNESPSPVFTFSGHFIEGFALDWSSVMPGWLATGDCKKNIHVWKLQDDRNWHVDQNPFTAHTASVEDIQWSPNEPFVFSSCSVDKSIRVWDVRAAPDKACMLTVSNAHESDVNVISWNKNDPFILSGGDDGIIKIWDLRQFQENKPTALFKHHTAPITSVEWNPNDSTTFAASGTDDQLTLWDLSVEKDTEEATDNPELYTLPPQLLFIHQGQKDIKELHWHPQLPGVLLSTALSGFNIFRTISV